MEEPQIIHYYSTLPEYAVIINNLNTEYEELIAHYINLSDKLDPIEKDSTKSIKICFSILVFITIAEFSIICILI